MSYVDELDASIWRSWGVDARPELFPEFRRAIRRGLQERDLDDTSDMELEVGGETFIFEVDGIILRRVQRCRR